MSQRVDTINEIISDLSKLKEDGFRNSYAIDQNITFFEAIKSFKTYIQWLRHVAPTIDSARLLELSDLPLPKWDRLLHFQLIEMSKKDFPGMIRPLKKRITQEITNGSARLILDLGCGGMEVVSQVIEELEEVRFSEKVIFIGVDQSPIVSEVVRENFSKLENLVEIVDIDILEKNRLRDLLERARPKHLVIVCKNNIFNLDQLLSKREADLVFHSRFKHHLLDEEKVQLDQLISQISKVCFEFDEYQSYRLPIIQALATWQMPPLTNGAVLSRIRETPREKISKDANTISLEFFALLGAYLKINIY